MDIVGSGENIYPERSRLNKISPNNRVEILGGSSRFSHLSYSPEWDNVYKLKFQVPIESKQLQMRLLGKTPSVFAKDSVVGGKGIFYDDDQLVMLGGGGKKLIKISGKGANPLGSTLHTVAYHDIRGGMREMEGSGLFLPRGFSL